MTDTAPIVWTPHASVDGLYLHRIGGLALKVHQLAETEWRATWCFVADEAGAVREMATHTTRRAAMNWCVERAAPERAGTAMMHLIGEQPRAGGR